MEQELIKLLSNDLKCTDCRFKDNQVILDIQSTKRQVICPYCNKVSSKIHSVYQREIQDIPMQDKQTILLLNTRKIFCNNPECKNKTFSERFDFVAPNGKKTKRLVNKILMTSTKLSSVSASSLLKAGSIKAGKSSICDLLKKNAYHCG